MTLPTSREEAERAIEQAALMANHTRDPLPTFAVALARIGLDALFPTDEVRERVARAMALTGCVAYRDDACWGEDVPLLRRSAARGENNCFSLADIALASLSTRTEDEARAGFTRG